MNAKMNDLATALTDAGISVRIIGSTLFANGWGIHCTLTGNVQARNVFDSHERFTLGSIQTPADVLACEFAQLP